LTYKGPKETGPLKIRPEAEIEVSDAEALAMILESVGFSVRLVIEKQREIWQYMGCEIGLDEVALLGGFIEIEGPDEDAVHAVIASLNLSGNETITTGYAEMIHHVLKQQGTGTRQALLDV
jgi:predicted adenylyl cyclase CyaB